MLRIHFCSRSHNGSQTRYCKVSTEPDPQTVFDGVRSISGLYIYIYPFTHNYFLCIKTIRVTSLNRFRSYLVYKLVDVGVASSLNLKTTSTIFSPIFRVLNLNVLFVWHLYNIVNKVNSLRKR